MNPLVPSVKIGGQSFAGYTRALEIFYILDFQGQTKMESFSVLHINCFDELCKIQDD